MNSSLMRLSSLLLIGIVISLGIWFYTRSNSHAQTDKLKRVEKAYSSNPQIRVTKIRIGEQLRQFDEEFDESDDWLSKMSLEIENISKKPIAYLQLNLNFPETRSSGNMMSYPVDFGLRPGSRFISSNKPLNFLPGEKLSFTLEEKYQRLLRFVETRHPMNEIKQLQVEIGFIIFNDRTAWAAGEFLRQDINNPDYYVNIGAKPPQ